MFGDSWWDELKRLSVRIMNKERKHLGSGVLYRHDEQNVFVFTAAHVVNCFGKDDVFFVECQPDKGEEHKELRNKYTFCVNGSDVCSYYEPNTFPKKTYRVNDAAVIKLDVRGKDWIVNRKEAKFPPTSLPLSGKSVAGYGYPTGKSMDAKGKEESISSAHEETREAICSTHITPCKHIAPSDDIGDDNPTHRAEWRLGISVSDPYSDDETAGWSGCTLFLTDTESLVMAGSAFAIYPNYRFEKFRGADMYYFRELLKTGFDITVNEYTYAELKQAGIVSGDSWGGLTLSPDPSDFWIHGSRDQFIDDLLPKIAINNPLILYGPAGCGKSEMARKIARRHSGIPYTITYQPSQKDVFTAIIKELSESEDSESKWLIIEDMYDPEQPFDKLRIENFYKMLQKLRHYVICTTRYDLKNSGSQYRIPYIFENPVKDIMEDQKAACKRRENDEARMRSALREQMCDQAENPGISKEEFDEFCDLTGTNLLLADWVARSLSTGFVDMKAILLALKTGNFSTGCAFPGIVNERTGKCAPIDEHISDLYDMDCLASKDRQTLKLLQFLGKEGIMAGQLRVLMPDRISNISRLVACGWLRQRKMCYNMDPVLKLACRCKGFSPDQKDLRELLEKMYNIYIDQNIMEHHSVIRAYYKAAKEVVPTLFDDEMLQWHSEICGVQGGW